MTRINTNVSSLVAQNRLQSSNNDLQTALTRLSTGLRINSGADDPAGLIASEALRSEITSLNSSISNTRRASQIVSTADSALGQVSSLLNDVRGLVVEAANSGALSDEEIAANQLQIDSSLEAINRIAQQTTFQGKKLLDGSLDFDSSISSVATVTDAQIDQANLGSTGSVDVEVVISSAAEQAAVTASAAGFTTAAQATVDSGVTFGTATQDINGEDIDIVGEGLVSITIVDDVLASNTGAASFDADTGVLTITANFTGDATNTGPPPEVDADVDAQDVQTAIAALDGFTATGATAAGTIAAATAATVTDAGEGLTITANNAGADYNNVAVEFVTGAAAAADFDTVTKVLTVTVEDGQSASALKAVIDDATVDGAAVADDLFTSTVVTDAEFASASSFSTVDTLVTGGETLKDDLVFQLNGTDGAETFNFGTGTSIDQIAAALNLVSDSTGVSATATATSTVELASTGFGSAALIDIEVISEGASGTFESSLDSTDDSGADIVASINGVEASGTGNTFSINTSALDVSLTVDAGSSTNFNFSITGGGAQFQLGPDVTSNQQARLGIGSVSTGQLGGSAGRLYELGSGQAKSLSNDVNGAAQIIDQVIGKVTGIRGRLGAFQSTSLESNLVSLNDTKANLQEAESSIRDADFAEESAKLTRAQILVQSGTNVLSLANQNPQNVLALLR